jgi:hypothetical protein
MTESKGNMYGWAKPWNPLGGKCFHDCSYCSTNRLRRFPTIDQKYSGPAKLFFDHPAESDKIIFVCGQSDLFAENIPSAWISNLLSRCRAIDNNYLFQTKNPARMKQFAIQFPERSILCTTIETNRRYPQMGNTPDPLLRAMAMAEHRLAGFQTQITIEPIMDFDLVEFIEILKTASSAKVNIGADSKHNHLPEPSKEKLLALIDELQKFTIIDRKTNLARLLK